ncbi:PAZ domain-containing protein [Cyathus striatus]|nr:PAZ domain-containing protein [Cyathus striatus]
MFINIDVSTATMHKEGSLYQLYTSFFDDRKPKFDEDERQAFQKSISPGIRVRTTYSGNNAPIRMVKKLTTKTADKLTVAVKHPDGRSKTVTVAAHFNSVIGKSLSYPKIFCAEIGSDAIPLELCHVIPGQIMRKQIRSDKIKSARDFSNTNPAQRLERIAKGLKGLEYGQSHYIREFGIHVDSDSDPLEIPARVLKAPTLQYRDGSAKTAKSIKIEPTKPDGKWNIKNNAKLFMPATVGQFVVWNFENRMKEQHKISKVIKDLVRSCHSLGIKIPDTAAFIKLYINPQTDVSKLFEIFYPKKIGVTTLVVAILPENASELYTALKYNGDVKFGVATQCLRASKCERADTSFYNSVCLKINVKLGGINVVPVNVAEFTSESKVPTIVMGADVIHPGPGSEDSSFAALVASVDMNHARYVADIRVQKSREEMIVDL